MGTLTLKDLAKMLNVSVTTVSKALKNYPDISEETKKEVRLLAEKLNYKPNIYALNLKYQKSYTIGVIVPKIEHYFFSEIIKAIIKEAENKGYLVIPLFSEDNIEIEKQQIRTLIDKRVDGILMALSQDTQTQEQSHILDILANDIQLVLFDRVAGGIPCSKVIIDDQNAAYRAVKQLIISGCKHIAFIGGTQKSISSRRRLNGYFQALNEFSIQEQPELIYHTNDQTINGFRNVALKAIDTNPNIDAIFATTDAIALGVISAIQQKGKRIPEDISVFGFGNWFVTEHLHPQLSTIDQPSYELGKKAIDLLLDEIQKKENHLKFSPQIVKLPTELILRQSTRKI